LSIATLGETLPASLSYSVIRILSLDPFEPALKLSRVLYDVQGPLCPGGWKTPKYGLYLMIKVIGMGLQDSAR
jgi:hypothetical protein